MLTWCKFPMHKDGVTFTHPSNLRKLLAIVISSCVHGKLYHADKMSTVLVNGARGEQSAGLHKSMQMTSCEIIMLKKKHRMPLCCLPLLDWRRWKEAFFISLFFSVSLSLSPLFVWALKLHLVHSVLFCVHWLLCAVGWRLCWEDWSCFSWMSTLISASSLLSLFLLCSLRQCRLF